MSVGLNYQSNNLKDCITTYFYDMNARHIFCKIFYKIGLLFNTENVTAFFSMQV